MVGAIAGGVLWGLAAGAIAVSKASPIAVAAACAVAVVVELTGVLVYRRSSNLSDRTIGMGLIVAPLTGLAPVLTVCVPSLMIAAMSWTN